MVNDDFWTLGFLEAQGSFAINIGFASNKTRNYITLRPVISFNSVDEDQMYLIKDNLKLEHNNVGNKAKLKKGTRAKILNVQNYEDIDKVIAFISDAGGFISERKQDKFIRFIEGYNLIKDINYLHDKWDDKIENLIEIKLSINNSKTKKEDIIKRIKEYIL